MPRPRRGRRRRGKGGTDIPRRLAQGTSPAAHNKSPQPEETPLRLAFGMIVFNGEHVLEASLESVYPFADQIVIAEGPVSYFVQQGHTSSTDRTVEIIKNFPDPQKKITLIQGKWSEKDEMCNAYAARIRPEMTFVWHLDSDEVWKYEDVKHILRVLPGYDSVGFRSLTFFGGFEDILTGFEQNAEFHRIQRWSGEGTRWATHRPPTILNPQSGRPWRDHRHLGYEALASAGVYMYHYSYVFPDQVKQKTRYYHDSVAREHCISDHYERVYKPWVLGNAEQRRAIEDEFHGVHDFLYSFRGECRTTPFTGQHPVPIANRLPRLRAALESQL